jgi:hypothetical protein
MALEDYIPNIFGGAPSGYEGLLGADQTASLQKRANLAGLLGSAAALAQGMGAGGNPRSAFQNITSALLAGYGGAGQTYQSGLQNLVQQQQLALQQRQMAGVQAMKLKYPDLADEFDTNPAGAFRIVAEREQAIRKPVALGEGQTLVSPQGEVIYASPQSRKKNTAVVGNRIIDLDTGQPIFEAPQEPKERKTAVVNGVLVDTQTGEPIYGTPTKQAPEIKDFQDGTTRQFDATTGSWKIIARKPAGEQKSMYAGEPTVDANGRLVFLPKQPGLPVVDAQTGKPVDFVPKGKPLPSILQKSEEEDYDAATAAINLSTDANKYVNSILGGTIKFGLKEKARIAALSAVGSGDPDVVARNDFDRWKLTYTNESLRLNKGTQTEGDAVRAAKELNSAESKEDAAKAILTLRDINARRVNDYSKRIVDRRKNAGAGEPEAKIDIPKFEPVVITPADYAKVPDGVTYIDVNGIRRVKGKRQ